MGALSVKQPLECSVVMLTKAGFTGEMHHCLLEQIKDCPHHNSKTMYWLYSVHPHSLRSSSDLREMSRVRLAVYVHHKLTFRTMQTPTRDRIHCAYAPAALRVTQGLVRVAADPCLRAALGSLRGLLLNRCILPKQPQVTVLSEDLSPI